MKATIHGVAVEGTVEEVWAMLQRANAQGLNLKPVQPMPHWDGPWWGIYPPVTSADTITVTIEDGVIKGHGFVEPPKYVKR